MIFSLLSAGMHLTFVSLSAICSRTSIAANSSRIGCRDQGLSACWRDECRVNFSHAAGLIDGTVHFFLCFEEHRTRRVDGHAAIAVILRESAGFHDHHHGSWVRVPSGISARLKYQQTL